MCFGALAYLSLMPTTVSQVFFIVELASNFKIKRLDIADRYKLDH